MSDMEIVGENGRINSLFAAGILLGEDVFFFNEGDIVYDGTHHIMQGIQVNSELLKENEGLRENVQMLAAGLAECMMTVEQNEKLMVPLSRIGQELRPYIYNEDLTGFTLMHLFAWHLLILPPEEDMAQMNRMEGVPHGPADFTVVADVRILNALPDARGIIEELFHAMLRYNEADRDFTMNLISMRNCDVP